MAKLTDNPYAAPENHPDTRSRVSSYLPISVYGYGLAVFLIAMSTSGFVLFPVMYALSLVGLPRLLLFLLACASCVAAGVFCGMRMYRRLADLHRRKIAWQREQIERLGEYF